MKTRKLITKYSSERNYKINKSLWNNIVQEYSNGAKIPALSIKHKVCIATISKIIRSQRPLRKIGEDTRKYPIQHNFFDKIDTEAKAYFLGFLFADGYNDEKYYVTLGLQSRDQDIIKCLLSHLYPREVPKLFFEPRSIANKRHKDISRYTICSSVLAKTLKKHGMIKRKSLCLKPPICVPKKLLRHFLRGYFDGDGSVWVAKPHLYFRKKTKVLVQYKPTIACNIVGTLDVLSYFRNYLAHKLHIPMENKITLCGNIYKLTMQTQVVVEKIYHLMYDDATIFLPRKKAIFNKFFI